MEKILGLAMILFSTISYAAYKDSNGVKVKLISVWAGKLSQDIAFKV